jgi:hypothetical protein
MAKLNSIEIRKIHAEKAECFFRSNQESSLQLIEWNMHDIICLFILIKLMLFIDWLKN